MSCQLVAAAVVCAALGSAIYINTLQCGIVYDDEPAILKNKDLRPTSAWVGLLFHDFWGTNISLPSSHKSFRPLCVATYRLNYLIHELEPLGYHLVNVLLHASVCFLFSLFCGVVLCEVWPALMAGLLFAVHPIHTEAVAGLVGRTELLSALFFILAFLAYSRAAWCHGAGLRWVAVCIFFSVCSLLSKEQGITVVSICLIYELFIVHQVNWRKGVAILKTALTNPRKLPRWLPFFMKRSLALVIFTILILLLRWYLSGGSPNIFTRNINPPLFMETPYRQLNWLYLIFINVWQLLNPYFLCPDWRFGTIPLITSFLDLRNILTLTTLTCTISLGVYGLHYDTMHAKKLLFGCCLMVITFLPASNLFIPVGFVVAERVLYLPSMGFCYLVAYGMTTLVKSFKSWIFRITVVILASILLGLLASRAILRNEDWKTNISLYTSGVRCNPNNGVMLTNLGIQHGKIKPQNLIFSEKLYRRAMKVAPQFSGGFSNFGGLMQALKRYDEAEEAMKKAIKLGEKDSTISAVIDIYDFLINKIVLRKGRERYEDALALWDQAMTVYPTCVDIYAHKGSLLYKMERGREAVPLLDVAIRSGSQIADVYYYLGMCYLDGLGDVKERRTKEEVGSLFKKTLQLEPRHSKAAVALKRLFE